MLLIARRLHLRARQTQAAIETQRQPEDGREDGRIAAGEQCREQPNRHTSNRKQKPEPPKNFLQSPACEALHNIGGKRRYQHQRDGRLQTEDRGQQAE